MNFKNKIYLAPMFGITDKSYRQKCLNLGCDVVETPLISAIDIIKHKPAAINEIKSTKDQHLCGVQIFCSNCPDALHACEEILKISNPDFIDINCCCPSPRVTKAGSGASLLRDPKGLGRIIKYVTSKIKTPITIKILSG
jgi:tRNA-dihydrouridine synthase B